MLILVIGVPFSNAQSVPDWVKNTAGWWATDAISETEFVNAIEFLINDGIIEVNSSDVTDNSQGIPDWVKNTAGWWATDAISETEFVNAISFLVNVGIINIESEDQCVNDFLKFFDDKDMINDICQNHKQTSNLELSPYVNELRFNSLGLRGGEISEVKNSETYRIFVVGGSTTVSAEVSEEETIPGLMQKMFDEEGKNVEVINAGISGGTNISEGKLIEERIVNYDPDLVIMYDGWNDLSADYTIAGNIFTYENICAVSMKNNFPVIFTLQPIAGFGNKELTFQEEINALTGNDHNDFQLLQARSTYDYTSRELKILDRDVQMLFGDGKCDFHDLRGIFDQVKGPIYWDQGHTLQAGNLIIAEKFFDLSMKKLDPDFKSDFKFTELISKYNSQSIMNFLLDKLNVQEKSLDKDTKDELKIDFRKGKYFLLKSEQQDISNILVGNDLRNVDLSKLNLKNQDLTGANLSGHDLRYVDLSSTIIRGANLSYTNLEGKNLSGMDLRGIDFSNAKLKDVDFTGAIFSKTIQAGGKDCKDENVIVDLIKLFNCTAKVVENESFRNNFENADLTNAKFGKSLGQPRNQMIYFTNFENADLTNTDIHHAQIIGCNFNGANLDGMNGKQLSFLKNSFKDTKLNNFNIKETWFQMNSFESTQMKNGVFENITFINSYFPDADLQGTEFINLNASEDNRFHCKNNVICVEP